MNFFEFSSLCLLFIAGIALFILILAAIQCWHVAEMRKIMRTLEAAARYQCAVTEAHENTKHTGA